MKKVIALACLSMLPLSYAAAEGYQVNAQSAKQAGMGHVGAAMKLGAESMHFNPAGLSFMKNKIQISGGVSGIFSTGHMTNAYLKHGVNKDRTYEYGDTKYEIDNKPGTPFFLYAGFKIYDNLAAGVTVNNQYGSSMNWGKDWIGAHLIQDIKLQSFTIQPTISWKVFDRLSIGAGLMMDFGNIELSRALVGPGELGRLANSVQSDLQLAFINHPEFAAITQPIVSQLVENTKLYDDASAASVTMNGTAGVRFGFNVGAMFDVNEKITVGVSYRSKIKMKVKEGDIALNYANFEYLKENVFKNIGAVMAIAKKFNIPIPVNMQIPPLDQGSFSSSLPLPSNLNVGITYRPTDRWTVSGEVQFVGWGAYDKLSIEFSPSSLSPYNMVAEKNYKNVRIYRVGSEYKVTNRFDVRLGAYFDETPVEDDFLNPETPSMSKLGLTCGFSFRPTKPLSVDFAFAYVTGFGRDGSYSDSSLLTGLPREFGGHYNIRAFVPTIGLSYGF